MRRDWAIRAAASSGTSRSSAGGERPDRVVGGDDLDERVERVGAAERLVGGGDRRVDHRARVDEVAEVDDPRDALGVVARDEHVAGVDVAVDRRERDEGERGLDDRLVAVEVALDERAAVGREIGELGAELGQPRDVPEQGPMGERVGEPGERLVEARRRRRRSSGAWWGWPGRAGARMPSMNATSWTAWSTPSIATEPVGAAVDRAARLRDRQRRVGPERVLHREHLHLDGARRVRRVADLEDERAAVRVDPEVAVALALERRRLALDAEDRARRSRPRARPIPRADALRGRRRSRRATIPGSASRTGRAVPPAAQCALAAVSVSNCSSSVEPLSASVELVPPVIVSSTWSK